MTNVVYSISLCFTSPTQGLVEHLLYCSNLTYLWIWSVKHNKITPTNGLISGTFALTLIPLALAIYGSHYFKAKFLKKS
jgi:hypothetical protein